MKIKDIFSPFLFIALGVAFLALSVWVFFSRNEKAVRYKYKIGGLILSLSFFSSSCGVFTTCYEPAFTCYDMVPPNSVYSVRPNENLTPNDSLFFMIYETSYDYYSFLLTDSVSKQEFKKDFLEYSEETYTFFLPLIPMPGEYQGRFIVNIYGEEKKELKQENLIYTQSFILKKDAEED